LWPADRVERWPIDRLVPYARNARTHSEAQIEEVAASIREWGWTNPVLVSEDGGIIAGHCRVLAGRQLGLAEVPVMLATGWSEAQKRAYVLADNQLALNAGWNPELLRLELGELKELDFDLGLIGFDDAQLAALTANPGLTDPDEVPEPPAVPIAQRGEVWQLGRHRLMCGDATEADQVIALMDGKRAALFATDPPYAVGYSGGSHPATKANRGKANRNKNWIDYKEAGLGEAETNDAKTSEEFYRAFIAVAVEHAISKQAPWYCWHASRRQAMVERVWNEFGAFVHQQIIWAKSRPVLTYSQYMWQHEPCLFGWIKGNRAKVCREAGGMLSTVWQVPNAEIESAEHPTSKPARLFTIPIEQHTVGDEICYEPFCGSGTQIIAAEQLGRRCYALEISPLFVDVSIERWQNFTGEKARRA
jgi:DNA modification methylase